MFRLLSYSHLQTQPGDDSIRGAKYAIIYILLCTGVLVFAVCEKEMLV